MCSASSQSTFYKDAPSAFLALFLEMKLVCYWPQFFFIELIELIIW